MELQLSKPYMKLPVPACTNIAMNVHTTYHNNVKVFLPCCKPIIIGVLFVSKKGSLFAIAVLKSPMYVLRDNSTKNEGRKMAGNKSNMCNPHLFLLSLLLHMPSSLSCLRVPHFLDC